MKKLLLLAAAVIMAVSFNSCENNPEETAQIANGVNLWGLWFTEYTYTTYTWNGSEDVKDKEYKCYIVFDIKQGHCQYKELDIANGQYTISIDDEGYVHGISEEEWNKCIENYSENDYGDIVSFEEDVPFSVADDNTFIFVYMTVHYTIIDENTIQLDHLFDLDYEEAVVHRMKGFAE